MHSLMELWEERDPLGGIEGRRMGREEGGGRRGDSDAMILIIIYCGICYWQKYMNTHMHSALHVRVYMYTQVRT